MPKPAKILLGSTAALVILAVGAWLYVQYRARDIVDEQMASMVQSGRYDALSYESLQIAPDGTVTMEDLRVERDGNTAILQEIRIADYDLQHEQPWYMDVEINGFEFPDGLADLPGDPDPATVAMFEDQLDDGTLPLRVRYRYDYSPDDSDRIDSTLQTTLENAFDMSLSSTTRGISLESFSDPALTQGDPMQAMAVYSSFMTKGELPSATLVMTDQGMLDDILQHGAQSNGVSPEEFRAALISQARNFYLFMPQNVQGVAMQIGMELATFLEGNRTMQVTLEPQFGGSFAQLQPQVMGAVFTGDFNKVLELLNLRIQTTPLPQ